LPCTQTEISDGYIFPYSNNEPTTVEVVALSPMRNPDLRVVMFVPVDGFIPPARQG
jgi:hypothetical protein